MYRCASLLFAMKNVSRTSVLSPQEMKLAIYANKRSNARLNVAVLLKASSGKINNNLHILVPIQLKEYSNPRQILKSEYFIA